MNHLGVYEVALGGPFVRHLTKLPNYRRSYFWDDTPLGAERDGVVCQDLRKLTFGDQAFDLVISSDVMEHVFEPLLAFAEVTRVLRIGGVHIFSIPTEWPLPAHSVERARMTEGGVEHMLEARYHRAGDGAPCLVVTDWGSDLVDRLRELGNDVQAIRRSAPLHPAYTNLTFVARRMR
jgi:SAM-dependent methyltransferase